MRLNPDDGVWAQDGIAHIEGTRGTACQGARSGEKGVLPSGEKSVSGDYAMANGLAFSDYDSIRKAAADWIIRLQEVSR